MADIFPKLSQEETHCEESWTYSMRRNMQEILPGLFLGPYGAATKSKLDYLQQAGISHLVCVRMVGEENVVRLNFQEHFKCSVIEMSESRSETIIPKMKQFQGLLEECFSDQGKLLVYCVDGMSRAPALVMGFIMYKYGLTYQESMKYVQQRRFCIQPSPVFEVQLKELEPICKAQQQQQSLPDQPSRQKRCLDESEGDEGQLYTKINQNGVVLTRVDTDRMDVE
jgi:serine/threonine/tyrosine-interacting protein